MRVKQLMAGFVIIGLLATTLRADTKFLKPDSVDFKTVLGPPPAADSDEAKQDLAEVLKLQESRTPEEVKRANQEVALTPFTFSQVLGSSFNPDDLPATAIFLKQVLVDYTAVSTPAKDFYKRPRPFNQDKRVEPCVPKEKSASYPSGHAGRSMILALVLSEIYPDQKDALTDLAKQIGHDRVLGGAHFPSDVAAGQKLAQATFDEMMKSPEFKAALDQAKEECHGGKKNPATTSPAPVNP